MSPDKATKLCIASIRHGCIDDKHQWVATVLESGTLAITSGNLLTAYKELVDSIEHIGCGTFLGDGHLCGDGVEFLCEDCQKIAGAKKKVDKLSKGVD